MNSNDKKNGNKRPIHCNAAKKRNLQFKYIPLNNRKKNRSEPMLMKYRKTEFHHGKIKKTPVVVNHGIKKNPQVLKGYSDVRKKSLDTKIAVNYPIINKNVKTITKRPSIKSSQKKNPGAKHGSFTEKIVSMWHYAKSFLGFSNSSRQNAQNCSMEDKHTVLAKAKRPVYVAKKPLIHHSNKDYRIEKHKKIVNESKVNVKANEKETKKRFEFKDKANKINTKESVQIVNKLMVRENERIEEEKQIVLKEDPNTVENLTKVNLKSNYTKEIETESSIILNDGLKEDNKDVNQSLQHAINSNEKEEIEVEKQIVLNEEVKKDLIMSNQFIHENLLNIINVEVTEKDKIPPETPKKDITLEIKPNESFQHENKSIVVANENEIEAENEIVYKDILNKGITVEINTTQSVCEISTKTNYYKSPLNDTNATITIEIKNASNQNKQPQTLNVNYATLDIHKSIEENCEKNVLSLLNSRNVKQNNITQLIKRGPCKAPITKKKEFSKKDVKVQDKKKPQKKNQHLKKTHHEDTKRCERHRSISRPHKIKHVKKRKCSTCREYISTDHSKQRKSHHNYHETKDEHKERCSVCNKRVRCLYHHNKKNHSHNYKHLKKELKSLKTPTKNKSTYNNQKKKRTLTVCTNSRRNSFKRKKLKKSSTQIKPSTSKILPKYMPYPYVNDKSSDSLDSDSDSDRQEAKATKVLSWWYFHYALNAVQHARPTRSNEIDENLPFLIPYGEYCSVYQAVSEADFDADNSSSNDDFDVTTNFSRHPNSFTDEETTVSENIYPNSSLYSSIHNFEDTDTNVSIESTKLKQEMPNNTPHK